MKLIALTRGQYAQVDDEDYEYLNQWKWYAKPHRDGSYYAERSQTIRGEKTKIKMHRHILQVENKLIEVDHIDKDKLNNRRSNLRIANRSQNQANRRKSANKSSQYLGVTKQRTGWVAQCRKDGKQYQKYCKTEESAAIKYNEMAINLHGEFAALNKV